MSETQYGRETNARLNALGISVAEIGRRLGNSHNLLAGMILGIQNSINKHLEEQSPDHSIRQVLTRLTAIASAQYTIQQQIAQIEEAVGPLANIPSVAAVLSTLETQMLTMQATVDAQGVTLRWIADTLKPQVAITTGELTVVGHQPEPIA